MILISVIIPTFNKAKILQKSLIKYDCQSLDKRIFEIIVVDDGSAKNEKEKVREIIKGLRIKVLFFEQKHLGPAAARNLGIKKAKGKIVLLVNDDTIPSLDFIKGHLLFHWKHLGEEYGLLSYLTWDSGLEITSFMKWLENGGPYFSFNKLESKTEVGWERFWTCGVSVKKSFLLKAGLFDEQFPFAAWEDIELGYRLNRKGLKLFYDKSITAFHYHPTTLKSVKNKMLANGEALILLRKKIPKKYHQPLVKYPKLAIFLDKLFLPKPFFEILENLAFFFEKKFVLHLLYTIVLLHYRIEGLRNYELNENKR